MANPLVPIGVWLQNLYRARQAARAARIANQAKKGPGLVRQGVGGAAFGGGFSLMQGNDLPPQAMGASGMGGRGFGFGAGGGMGGMGGMSGVTAAQATSALQDGDSSNAVVNAIQDLKEVVVSIKGDTATIATGIFGGQGKAEQPPSENAVRGMFGGSGGGLGATAAAGTGIGAALGLMLLNKMQDGEKEIDAETGVKDYINNVESKSQEAYEEVKDFIYDTEEGIFGNLSNWADNLSATIRNLTTSMQTKGMSKYDKVLGTFGEMWEGVKTTVDAGSSTLRAGTQWGMDKLKNLRNTPNVSASGPNMKVDNVIDMNTRQPISVEKIIPEVAEEGAGGLADSASKTKIAKAIAMHMGEYGAKMIPLVGIGAGLLFTGQRLWSGDRWGALAEGIGVFLPSLLGSVSIDAGLLARDVYNSVYGRDEQGNIDPGTYLRDQISHPVRTAKRYGEIYDMTVSAIDEMIENAKNPPFDDRQEYLDAMEDLGTRPEDDGTLNNREKRMLSHRQKNWDKKHEKIIQRASNTKSVTSMFPEFAEMTKDLGSDNPFESQDLKTIPDSPIYDSEMFNELRQQVPLDAYKTLSTQAVDDPSIKTNVMTTEEATLLSQAYQDMLDRVAMMGAMQYAQGVDPSKIGAMQTAATNQAKQEFQQHITRAVERVDYSPYDPQVAGVMLSSAGIEGIRKTFSQ